MKEDSKVLTRNSRVIDNLIFSDLSNLGYGKRVSLFKADDPSKLQVNPRKQIGKIGVQLNSSCISRIFSRSICVSAAEANSGISKKLYLNRSSVIKWLNAHVTENDHLKMDCKDNDILSRIEDTQKGIFQKSPFKEQVNRRDVDSLGTRIQAFFWKNILRLTSSWWPLYAFRLKVLSSSEKSIQTASEVLACSAFQDAKSVSAYQKHIGDVAVNQFNNISETSKDNYIKANVENELALYHGEKIPTGAKKDTSTGTSGKPTSWYRGSKELESINTSFALSAKSILGNKPYYLINGFALGPWATGVAIANAGASDPNATVCNIGFDTKQLFQAIKDAVKVIPQGQPIVIAGYPPHLKEVVDLAIQEDFPLHDYEILGLVGGESMSERQRELISCQRDSDNQILRTGFTSCYSAYGASDLDVTIGFESDYAFNLRQELHKNPELARELLGDNEFVPMIFPYDPLNYHIETDEDQNLLFTCVRGDRISPRVRYNLGDRGKTMPLSDVQAILKKHNVNLKSSPNTQLPLLFVWGRVDSQVTYFGVNLAPENLEDSLRSENLFSKIAHYGFLQYEKEGTPVTEILIEGKDGADFSDKEQIHKSIIEGLKNYNEEFNKLLNGQPNSVPELRIYEKGKSPMAIQRERYPHLKNKYIFREGDEFVPNVKDV
jgi:phenylacetate-coenzyme A ligase PaaK-like adenylate-forming protein